MLWWHVDGKFLKTLLAFLGFSLYRRFTKCCRNSGASGQHDAKRCKLAANTGAVTGLLLAERLMKIGKMCANSSTGRLVKEETDLHSELKHYCLKTATHPSQQCPTHNGQSSGSNHSCRHIACPVFLNESAYAVIYSFGSHCGY